MRNTFLHKAQSIVLVALLLVQNTGAYGISHVHLDGEQSHSHADEELVEHVLHSHPHPHFHRETRPAEAENEQIATTDPHSHITLLGFDFSIPAQEDSPENNDHSQPKTFVRLADDYAVVLATRSVNDELLQSLLIPFDDYDATTTYAVTSTAPQVLSPPLCDSARFERSGVLLI